MVLFGYVTRKIWRIVSSKPDNGENQLGKVKLATFLICDLYNDKCRDCNLENTVT